jgi:hypothetical protein
LWLLRPLREMCEDFAPNFGDKKNWMLHHDNILSHTSFSTREFFFTKKTWLSSPTHPTRLTCPLANFLCLPGWKWNWNATILTQSMWSEQNRRRRWTPSQNTTSRTHFKMTEALGKVNTRGRGLLRGWRWPVGPTIVFDQMSAPVPKIMDDSLHSCRFCSNNLLFAWVRNSVS